MIYIGIDPGLDGAIAALNQEGQALGVWDMPTLTLERAKKRNKDGKPGKKRVIDLPELWKIFQGLNTFGGPLTAGLELIHAMPDQGVASMFSMGQGFGILQMALVAAKIPHTEVYPQRWKGQLMEGLGKDKKASVYRARQLFPGAPLEKLGHHGRADALMIGEYVRRTQTAGDHNIG